MRTLSRGQRGPDVERWQQFLVAQGVLRGKPDGVFGARAYAATRVYQAREGLPVDGEVAGRTLLTACGQGYRPIRRLCEHELEPEVRERAREILSEQWDQSHGSTTTFSVAGREYLARLEETYNAPGSAVRPWGYVAALSLFRILDAEESQSASAEEAPTFEGKTRPMLQDSVGLAGGGLIVYGRYRLTEHSESNLVGVHESLRRVVERAITITDVDFCVTEGVRTIEKQRELFAIGATRVLKSRHLTGHAVDLAPWVGATISWHWPHFRRLSVVVKRAADEVGVPVQWGGDWVEPDGPHWELPYDQYP